MFTIRLIKFFVVLALVPLGASACRLWQKTGGETPSPTPFVAEEIKSEIPFSTREPEVFQVEIVVRAGSRENKTFMARSGGNRRFDYDAGAKNQISVVRSDKYYLLNPNKKIYAENASENILPAENRTDFLTTEWLNARTDAKFFKEGAENNLAKYRVVFGEAENAVSETIIYVDEAAELPVKQEFYSLGGGERVLTMTVELRNLKLEAEAALFNIPPDFKKVSAEEFRTILKKENE